MTTPRLAVIVPTRGRPQNVRPVMDAWAITEASLDADVIWAIDEDDPQLDAYRAELSAYAGIPWVLHRAFPEWLPMVHKLELTAREVVERDRWSAVGFAGDDHLPRTVGWAASYLAVLTAAPGIVYGRDGMRAGQEHPLPTQWAMSTSIVSALGRMVPAPVEHLFCDNAIRDLGRTADCLTHLPHVLIEHMHPMVDKAEWDGGYRAVNSEERYASDHAAYVQWCSHGVRRDAETVRGLRAGYDAHSSVRGG